MPAPPQSRSSFLTSFRQSQMLSAFLESPQEAGSFLRPHAKFTPDEDALLRSLVERFGTVDWNLIAERIPGRNPRQCKERWMNYLTPDLNGSGWTREEDWLLITKQRELGSKWVRIAKFFPNRTDAMVKNRFNRLKRRDQKQQDIYSRHEPLLLHMCQTARFWAVPRPSIPSEPLPPIPQEPIRQEAAPIPEPAQEPEVDDFSLWGDHFSGGLDCFFGDPIEFAC
jgi:hypothetical protein